jgi:hypothetical protein
VAAPLQTYRYGSKNHTIKGKTPLALKHDWTGTLHDDTNRGDVGYGLHVSLTVEVTKLPGRHPRI